jgi:poly(hydroxyalkanoate) depolymerase family esterase
LCFNWFEPAHTRRGTGEALSIAQMVEAMVEQHDIDPARVFITGLSAGGAMTSVMLATYPEKFAGGAILAGLPHGAAASVQEALQQMRGHTPSRRTTGRSISDASAHAGRWPAISIWHGTADAVVDPSNSDAILRQWQEVHGLPGAPTETDKVDGHPHRVWRDVSGTLLIEDYRVTGMGHGAALATGGDCGCGEAGAFMLEVGISSTVRSAQAWGLLGKRVCPGKTARPRTDDPRDPPAPHHAGGVGQVIHDALRAAGLMK